MWKVDDGTVSVVPGEDGRTMLTGVFPNPSSSRTTVSFALRLGGRIKLSIHDLTGRRLIVLSDHEFASGPHSLTWNGRDSQGGVMPSGTYMVRLETESGVESRKVTWIR
jgi:flagellar hook assembly protein FlgD